MFRVFENNKERVVENGGGFLKGNRVFFEVLLCLLFVPFKIIINYIGLVVTLHL